MHKSIIIALGTFAACAASVLKRASGTCDSPEFSAITTIGSTSGTPFCESNWGSSYLPVTNLTVFAAPALIKGIQLTYSDGSQSAVIGQADTYSVKSIGVDYVSNIGWDRISLYTRSANTYLHHLYIETTNGAKINSGEVLADDPNYIRYDQNVGSKILYGVSGTTASDGSLSSLGFLFLASPVVTLRIENIQFPNGPIGTSESITPTDIGTAHFYNNANPGDPAQTYTFANSLTQTQSWAFAQAITDTFATAEAIMVGFMFSLPMVLSISSSSTTTFTWTEATMDTTTTTVMQATMVGYNAQIPLNPGQGVDCVAVAGQGSGTFPYTSTVTIGLKNGNNYTFAEDGYLTVSSVSQGSVECNEANHP